jgi:hypothetical protein
MVESVLQNNRGLDGRTSTDNWSFFMSRHALHRPTVFAVWAAGLALILSACGGGGGSGAAATDNLPAGGGGGANVPASGAPGLQSHLSACPNTLAINEKVACMVGGYEGKTTDSGTDCAFTYGSDGVAYYTAGAQTLRVDLNPSSSGAVFEKKSAGNSAGFSITWSIGIASGHELGLWYQAGAEPASANGLLIKAANSALPACLVSAGPAGLATGDASVGNLLGRAWQGPLMLNGGSGAVGLLVDQPAFDAGLADDGRAFVVFRQPDAGGRMSVQVVEGRAGAAGQAPAWTAPQVLDADAPLLADGFRPRVAVSANGHAVVMWAHQRACDADGYHGVNAGKTCRYVYASRRLAPASAWEPALRVAAAPLMATDYYARINSRGDAVLVFQGAKLPQAGSDSFDPASDGRVVIARRAAGEAGYRIDRSEWIRRSSTLRRLSEWVHVELDEASNIAIAAETNALFGKALHTRLDMAQPLTENEGLTHDAAGVYESAVGGGGFSAYTWKSASGPYDIRKPQQAMVYSPAAQQWLNAGITPYVQWGDAALVGTDRAEGEFLLYSGCKLTAWRAGAWGATRNLPAYCGRDQPGGVYAFNRQGDYLGLNWAGQPGQWGYYSYAQDKMLKGAPGAGQTKSGDFVLGTPSSLFGTEPTQLLLASSGLALAVTTNTYTVLPSAADAAGVSGAGAAKLWAVYLK